MTKKVKSISDLNEQQVNVIEDLLAGKIAPSTAKEAFNGYGKVSSGLRVLMDYNRMTGKKDKIIKFLEDAN